MSSTQPAEPGVSGERSRSMEAASIGQKLHQDLDQVMQSDEENEPEEEVSTLCAG